MLMFYGSTMQKEPSPEDPDIWSLQLRLMEALAHAERHDPIVAAHIEAALAALNLRFNLL